jgi:putative PIG3 family NAD(P)H quinone oxidoreductase
VYAVTITSPGGPEVLRWTEVPDPTAGPDEVLVEVAASALNRADVLQRQGNYQPPPGASPYPGMECAGRIISSEHPDWRPGDEVCALLAGGGYAQQVAVPVGQLLPVPRNLSVEESAALPEVACTVWSNVVDLAGLKAGQTLLVHGGGSGIGTFAIQLGAALGATVLTTARQNKHAELGKLGASRTIDYAAEDFVAATLEATGGRGADVILDIIGGSYLDRNVRTLATDGHLVVIGMQGGRKAELDLGALLAKRGTVSATALRGRSLPDKARIVRGVREQVWPLVEQGRIRPVIDRRLPMSQAAEAHRVLEASDHVGKVVLAPAH